MTAVKQAVAENSLMIAHGTTTIGRGKKNTLVIAEETVSLVHAKIVAFNKTGYIEDLGSTNGTYVNGKNVHQHMLHEGDHVNVGAYSFIVAGFE